MNASKVGSGRALFRRGLTQASPRVNETALMVTNSLQDDGWQHFSVSCGTDHQDQLEA